MNAPLKISVRVGHTKGLHARVAAMLVQMAAEASQRTGLRFLLCHGPRTVPAENLLHFLPHWRETDDPGLVLAVFSTGPAIRNTGANLLSEIIGTFVLVLGVLAIGANTFADGITPFIVGVLVWGIGLSLGGTTGYAINPARDLGPRIAHAVLPIPGKGGSDWGYSWIPVVGPIIGGVLGALFFKATFGA